MTELVVLNYATSEVDFYSFDMDITSDTIEDFLFVKKKYRESEISWMVADNLFINNYGNNY